MKSHQLKLFWYQGVFLFLLLKIWVFDMEIREHARRKFILLQACHSTAQKDKIVVLISASF